jgi:hypothetical protein
MRPDSAPRHRLERRHPDRRRTGRQGKSAGGGNAGAQAGKRSRTFRNTDEVDVGQHDFSRRGEFLHDRHKSFSMAACHFDTMCGQTPPVTHDRRGADIGAGLECQR